MGAAPVSWLDIPVYTGNLEQLEKDITSLRKDADKIRGTGADTHSTFQGLSAYYKAPETGQLLATTKPVRDRAEDFALQLEQVATALDTYATEIRPLVKRLESLSSQALAFETMVEGDDNWDKDEAKTDKSNKIFSAVNIAVAQFQAAERACASAIRAVIGLPPLVADDGSHGKNMYGLSVADMKKVGETPWGSIVEQDLPWYQDVGNAVKGVVWDGFIKGGMFGLFEAVGMLVNPFGDDFGAAWTGLGKALGGVGVYAKDAFDWGGHMVGEEDSKTEQDLKSAANQLVKSVVAYDEWDNDPAKAAGITAFNILTLAAAPTGASKAAKAVRVAQHVDPIRAVAKAVPFAKARMADLKGVLTQLRDLDAVQAVKLPDGTHTLPDGTPAPRQGPLPEGVRAVAYSDGVVKVGDNTFLHPDGSLRNARGDSIQPAHAAPHEPAAAERATNPTAAPEHELAGVGARQDPGDLTARADAEGPGSRDPDPSRTTPADGSVGREIPDPHGSGGRAGSGGFDNQAGPPPRSGENGQSPGGTGPGSGNSPEEIVRQQVERANNDPAWFQEHYRSNGFRKEISVDENLNPLPRLAKDPATGKWIAADNLPPAQPPKYAGERIAVDRSTVPDQQLAELDAAAGARHSAIEADQTALRDLAEARRNHADEATPDNMRALKEAEANYSLRHDEMGRRSGKFGETVAVQHAIPDGYPGAVQLEISGPKNGTAQFDQIWRREDGGYVVVEAKSSASTQLGERRLADGVRVSQGTKEYFESILTEMRRRGLANAEEAKLARELRRALEKGKLDYVLVKGNPDGMRYGGYTMRKFDLDG